MISEKKASKIEILSIDSKIESMNDRLKQVSMIFGDVTKVLALFKAFSQKQLEP